MKIYLLLSMLFFLQPKLGKIYSKEKTVGYYDYAVTKRWELELKEQGTFTLTYKKKDSRFEKTIKFDFIGTWEKKNDTIVFKNSLAASSQPCYFKTVQYIVSESNLTLIGSDLCLPESFDIGNRFTIKI